jgi:hypothetical protein
MAFKYHDIVGIGDIHIPHDLEYANQATRLAGAGLGSQHVGRLCKQLDDGSYWVLTQFTPSITWAAFVPPEPVVGDIGSTLSVVTDGASGVKLDWTGDASVTLDDAYNNSGGASTITVDAGDVTWSPSGAYSFVVNSSSAGVGDGFEVVDGTDSFKVLHGGLNTLNLTASLASVNLDTSANFNATILGDTTWTPTGARSFIVDLSAVTGSVDGFNVVNGTDQFKLLYFGANSVQLDADLSSGDITTAAGMGISSGTVLSLIGSSSVNFATTPKLTTSAAQDLNIVPGTGGITVIGDAGSTSRGLNTNDDLFVSGKLEVDGVFYLDGGLEASSPVVIRDGIDLSFGTSSDASLIYKLGQTNDSLMLGVSSDSNALIVCQNADTGFNFDHSVPSNPAIFLHSANQATDEWLSISHEQTYGKISTGVGFIVIEPATGYYTKIGSGTSSHSLNSPNDLFVGGKIEVDGVAYFDAGLNLTTTLTIGDDSELRFGGAPDVAIDWSTAQTNNSLICGLGASRTLIFCDYSDRAYDFAHAAQSNPTIFLHSANQSTTEWISFAHDQTDGVITTGTGDVRFDTNILLPDNEILKFGSSDDCFMYWSTAQTNDALFLGVGASNSFIVGEKGDAGYNFAHSVQTNPTLFLHSANQSTTEWISIAHDQTDGVIRTGSGVLRLKSANSDVVIGSSAIQPYSMTSGGGIWFDLDGPSSIARSGVNAPLILNKSDSDGDVLAFHVSGAAVSYLTTTASEFRIRTIGKTLQLLPATGSITQIGDAGSTSRGLVANDDLFVSGQLEIDGTVYLDGLTQVAGSQTLKLLDDSKTAYGNSLDTQLLFNTDQTVNTFLVGVDGTSRSIIICDSADKTYDFNHTAQSNPTSIIHSANQSTTEWVSKTHNQTDAFEGIGSGSRVTEHETPVELADDGSFDLPAASAGFCSLIVGDTEEYAQFAWDSTATVTLIVNSTNVVATDTDTKFCIFDNGTSVRVRNRLGAAKKVVFDYHFTTP